MYKDKLGTPYAEREIHTVVGSPNDKSRWIYRVGYTGPRVREVDIQSPRSNEPPVTVVQLSDFHLNRLNEKDWEEQNPTLMSTYEHRQWLRDGTSVGVALNALAYADAVGDQTVITGDVLDYLAHGTVELINKYVWGKYPNVIVTAGNHDWCQQMEGLVPESLSGKERKEWLEKVWEPHHGLYYTSRIIKNKVMVIQLENGNGHFWDCQIEPLISDLALARKNYYTVLIFAHIPLWTNNPKAEYVEPLTPVADKPSLNLYSGPGLIGLDAEKGSATETIYNLIINNADVIKGVFTGHRHCDLSADIIAYTPDGEKTTITQYVMTTNGVDPFGAAIKITVK